MRYYLVLISFFISAVSFSQTQKITGTYNNRMPRLQVKFNADSTFEYTTNEQHPVFYRWEDFYEKGKWAMAGDTIILNPGLQKKPFVESLFTEQENKDEHSLSLTFNHIKRYMDADGVIISTDTLQIDQLDYSFNELKKRNRTRVSPHRSSRCAFAGYIPKETITASHSIAVPMPAEKISRIFIGCYELQGTKEFIIKNPGANHFTLNVYSNYYQDGQIRQLKFLVKNDKCLYTKQKASGEFEKDNIWSVTQNKISKENP